MNRIGSSCSVHIVRIPSLIFLLPHAWKHTFCAFYDWAVERHTAQSLLRGYIGISSYREPFYLMHDPTNAIDKATDLSSTHYRMIVSLHVRFDPFFICRRYQWASFGVRRDRFEREKLLPVCLLFLAFPVAALNVTSVMVVGSTTVDRFLVGINDSIRRRSQFVVCQQESDAGEDSAILIALLEHKIWRKSLLKFV